MSSELRRSIRIADFLPISLAVYRNQEQVSGPYSARIANISNHGVRLLMTSVMKGSFHVFHTTREDSSQFLRLFINLPDNTEEIHIDARPIWLDSTQMDDIKVFKIGADFITQLTGSMLKEINQQICEL